MSALRGKADITLMSAMGQKRTLAQRLKTPHQGLSREAVVAQRRTLAVSPQLFKKKPSKNSA